MAEKRRVIKIPEVKSTRVRYGRATLAIARCGGFLGEDLGRAINAFERDELKATELCAAFVRARIRRHSPSFNWDQADSVRLLGLVTEISGDPVFETADPEQVAQVLVETRKRESEMLRDSLRRMRKQIGEQAKLPGAVAAQVQGVAKFESQLQKIFKPLEIAKKVGVTSLVGQEWFKANNNRLGAAGAVAQLGGIGGGKFAGDHLAAIGGAGQIAEHVRAISGADSIKKAWWLKGSGVGADLFASQRDLQPTSAWINSLVGQEAARIWKVTPPDYLAKLVGKTAFPKFTVGFDHSQLFRGMPQLNSVLLGFEGIGERLRELAERIKEQLPENWRELETQELFDVVELMKTEGLCLAWAPRTEIVRELAIAGSAEQRAEILVRNRTEILDDIEQVLAEIEHPELADHVEATREAIATYEVEHPKPAQSYAATTISDLVSGALGAKSFGAAQRQFRATDPIHDVGMGDLPLVAVGWSLAYALDRFSDAGPGFNRNLTLHFLGPHYSEANLLMSLLLLAGFLPELEILLDQRQRRQLTATASA